MRRKPSMFSKNYRRELKKRRARRFVVLMGVILIAGAIIVSFDKGSVLVKSYFAKDATDDVIDIDEEKANKGEEGSGEEKQEEEKNEEEKITFQPQLVSGKAVIVEMKEENNKRVIFNIQCPEGVVGQISPSGEKGLIVDSSTQDIYIVETSEEVKNVTNKQYISTDKQVFIKESVLQYTPGYLWVEGAAFIDEDHVAYSSQLPWINEGGQKYLWVVNINDGTHEGYYNIKGSVFSFKETKTEGVSIEIDGKSLVVNSKGQVVAN